MDAVTAEKLENMISQLDAQILELEDLNIPGTRLLLAHGASRFAGHTPQYRSWRAQNAVQTVENALESGESTGRQRRLEAPANRRSRNASRVGATRRRA